MFKKVSYQTAPNIALVKYWGKFNQDYILPINDSIGLTLSTQDLQTITSVEIITDEQKDILILNKKITPISKRIQKMLDLIRIKASTQLKQSGYEKAFFKIVSDNSFPTASGMASSASGLSCLALCLNKLFGNIFKDQQISELARFGSGSACRSIFGGLVRWYGVQKQILQTNNKLEQQKLQQLSKLCISKQIITPQNLNNLNIIILLQNNNEKQISSTNGMKRSIQTSELINYRNIIAKNRIGQVINSLQNKNYNKLSELIIKDSNQFHAICLDTYPPIFYLNQFSKSVINIVDNYLNKSLKIKIGYTFDAGPHAFLIIQDNVLEQVFNYLIDLFELNTENLNQRAKKYQQKLKTNNKKQYNEKQKNKIQIPLNYIKPKELWLTKVGNNPRCIFYQ